ncbi:hypothetical protein C3L33_11394, partial [Rhododendron williamsianum]
MDRQILDYLPQERKEEVYSLRFDDESFREYQKIEFPFKSAANDFYRVVGCCNGVVCITDDQFRPEIDVYRLSSGSWEDISRSGGLGFYSIRKKAPQAYLNGAVHWFATDKRSGRHLVVSFDTGDELFRPIVVPDGVGTDLSCLVSVRPAVLERMVGFRKSGELLVEMSGGKLLSYDPETEKFTELEVDSNVSISTWFHAEGYKESLVLLGRYGLLGSQGSYLDEEFCHGYEDQGVLQDCAGVEDHVQEGRKGLMFSLTRVLGDV